MIRKINSLSFFFSLILILAFSQQGYSQDISIKGKVINAKNGGPVEFANIGVLLSNYGASSDTQGDFNFNVPAELNTYNIQITAVGYNPVNLSVSQFMTDRPQIIEMTPLAYDIDEVDIEAKSLRYYQILGQAVTNISKNYPDIPFNYTLSVKRLDKSGSNINADSITAKLYAPEGYSRKSHVNEDGYKIEKSTYLEEYKGLMPKLSHLGDALKFDIVKNKGNILDTHDLREFDLNLSLTENDSTYIIDYVSDNPDILFTGFAHAAFIKGRIYILKANYAVVKNEMEIRASKESLLGGEFSVDNKFSDENVSYFVDTNYQSRGNKYILKSIEIRYSSDENTRNEEINVRGFTDVNPEKINTRDILFNVSR